MQCWIKRQNALTMSDRYVLSDYPITDAKRTEWTTYRQALRDLPDNVTDAQILGGTIPNLPDLTDKSCYIIRLVNT